MAAYWALFSIFALGALFTHGGDAHRRATLPLIAAMVLLAVFIGLRWEIGPDWPVYRALFRFLHDDGFGDLIGQSDPGFRGLVMLLQWQHAPFWALNLICACIFSFGLAWFCTTLPNPWLGVLVAIPYLVIVIAMSALRQATAIGFIFLALRDMGTKPLWKSIFWVLIASLFHASAFIVAVLIALSYTQNRVQAVLLLIVSSIPAYYILFGTFDIYLRRYGQHRIDSGGVAFRVAMNAVPALILLIRGSRHFAPRGEEAFWRSLSFLSLALIPALLHVKSTTVIDRLSIYAIPLQILVLSEVPGQFSTSSATRIYKTRVTVANLPGLVLRSPGDELCLRAGNRPVGRLVADDPDLQGYLLRQSFQCRPGGFEVRERACRSRPADDERIVLRWLSHLRIIGELDRRRNDNDPVVPLPRIIRQIVVPDRHRARHAADRRRLPVKMQP